METTFSYGAGFSRHFIIVPLHICWNSILNPNHQTRSLWIDEPECLELIQSVWPWTLELGLIVEFHTKLTTLQTTLQGWNRSTFSLCQIRFVRLRNSSNRAIHPRNQIPHGNTIVLGWRNFIINKSDIGIPDPQLHGFLLAISMQHISTIAPHKDITET